MIDIVKGTHVVSFPSKIASACGQFGHIFNTIVQDNTLDNGTLCLKGDYVSFDQYKQAAFVSGDAVTGKIVDQDANGLWYVEIESLPANKTVLYMYNSPISEYPERSLQEESLFVNVKGDVVQGMQLMVNDVAEYSDDAFEGTPAVNTAVTYNTATNKWTI